MKKVVSILLTASMIACSAALPLTAIAAETTSVTTTTMPAVDDPIVQTAVVTVTIMDISGDNVLVKPVDGSPELKSSSKFSLSVKQLPAAITPKVGMKLEITYNGGILETYPAMFGNVQKVVEVKDDTIKEDPTLLKGTKDMTLNDVMRLAELGDELDWVNFKDYKGRDVGSGLYIWEFTLEDGYVLDVGGTTDKKPLYILLSHDDDKGIDIRTDDVKEYIASMTVPVVNENETVTYKIITTPDKTVYKLGESINLKGIQVEVQKGNEKPVIYAYPDVAFDYQSNIPKAPTVTLSVDYKRDKVGTVAIKVVGSDDALFTVEFVDDSTEKTQKNSVMLTTESGDDGCYIHLDLMSGTFTMSGSMHQNFAVFGRFERKGNDLYLYGENGSTNVYILHRDGSSLISQSDEKGINLTKGLAFSAENDAFWEKLTSTNESTVKGDANCDTNVNMSDAVIIMQSLANPDKYGVNGTDEHHITEQGKKNGDIAGNNDGITNSDALAIQRKLLGLDDEEKSFSTTLLGIDKAKVIGVKVSSLPEGYDYSFTDENAQSVVDYLSNISLSTNISVEDPGQLAGMTWVIRLVYENGDTVTLYDLGKFIHGEDHKWYEMTYEESQEFSNLIWKLGQTDNDKSIDNSAIAGKIFAYEKSADPGIYDDLCDLSFGSNGTYVYHIGYYTSSNQDQGTWEISGDTLVLTGQYGTNKFRYEDKALIYIAEESDGFSEFNDKTTPKDGEKFILAPERTYDVQTKSMNDVTVSIKSDLRPHMSDLSGIGILLEVNSNDYPVTLKATDGNFVEWDIEKGSGPVKTVGKEYDIGKNGYIFWNPDKLYYQDGFESEIQVIGVSGDVFIDVGKIYVSQVKGGIFEASFEKPSPSASTDNSVIAGKIFAYEKEGAGGYCTLSFNENGRFLYSPGKLSSYMGGGDWKIDGDTVSLIGMVDKTIYLKITDDTLVYIAEGSDEFPYMDIQDGEKFGIYRPEISSDKFQLNSRYTEYGLGDPKVELNLIASELPEFCYVENVRLCDEDDNFIGTMSPAMDADIWSYLVDCHVTEECSKTFYTLTKVRCGEKTYLDDVRSEITVNFKDTPAP